MKLKIIITNLVKIVKKVFLYLIKHINKGKMNYFFNQLKVKIELYFYKFFDSQKEFIS